MKEKGGREVVLEDRSVKWRLRRGVVIAQARNLFALSGPGANLERGCDNRDFLFLGLGR